MFLRQNVKRKKRKGIPVTGTVMNEKQACHNAMRVFNQRNAC